MANPTTNYGWPMPTSTDLVTDLPADFAAFGQPVDTSLKALNPETTLGDIAYRSATSNTNTRLGIGTAGQVLAVSGGVPAWTTTADVTPLTTKGDLFTFTTVDARIGVGANNTVLTADSAEASGLKWAASGSTFSGARVTKSANQSLTNVTYTTITFNQEPLDVGGYHDNSTNNTRLTVPSGKTGYFLVQWNLHAYNVTAMAYKLLKNGSVIAEWADSYNWTTGTEVDFTNQWLGALSAADYVEIQGWQTTGSAKNVYGATGTSEPSWFQITYLGA